MKRSLTNSHCDPHPALACLRKSIAVAVLALCLHGCGSGMQGVLGKGIDSVLMTGSTATPPVNDPNGPAILMALTQNPAPGAEWENEEDGSRGTISAINQREEDGVPCLAFQSTRESFDGIHLYEGTACQTPRGIMALRSLTQL